jgi:hypothetical protein
MCRFMVLDYAGKSIGATKTKIPAFPAGCIAKKTGFLKDACFGVNTDLILQNIIGFDLPGV